jgi:hypothetical protein
VTLEKLAGFVVQLSEHPITIFYQPGRLIHFLQQPKDPVAAVFNTYYGDTRETPKQIVRDQSTYGKQPIRRYLVALRTWRLGIFTPRIWAQVYLSLPVL